MKNKYIDRLKKLCERYESEISDVFKLSSIAKSKKGKFKGLSVEAFSKVSAASRYNRGKRS